jgi:cell division protein FtsB
MLFLIFARYRKVIKKLHRRNKNMELHNGFKQKKRGGIMMRRRKLVVAVVLALAVGLIFSGIAMGATGSKTLKAVYKNIKIIVDDKTITGSEEPFIVGDRVYVPFRMIGEALNATVNWDAATNSVKITGAGADSSLAGILQLQLLQKQKRVEELEAELAQLKASPSVKEGDLKELRKDLINDYDELKDLGVDDISLSGDKDKVKIDVKVDLYDYDREWKKLRDSDIEDWVSDIARDIQSAMGRDCYVEGKIIDSDSRDTLVRFTKDGRSKLKVDFRDSKYRSSSSSSDIRDVENSFMYEYFYVGDIKFEVTSIKYSTSDIINVTLSAVDRDARDQWEEMGSSEIKTDVKYICEDIAYAFEEDADADPEEVVLKVYDYSGKLLGTYYYDAYRERLK